MRSLPEVPVRTSLASYISTLPNANLGLLHLRLLGGWVASEPNRRMRVSFLPTVRNAWCPAWRECDVKQSPVVAGVDITACW